MGRLEKQLLGDNMKYLEELQTGDTFKIEDQIFVLTQDFKRGKPVNQRSCCNLNDGSHRWFPETVVVEQLGLYTLDKDNNVLPIKETLQIS